MNDADDALTPPPTGHVRDRVGARRARVAHRLNWNIGVPIQRWGLFASINGRWNSGSSYNHHDRPRRQRRRDLQRSAGRCRPQHPARRTRPRQTDMRMSWTLPSIAAQRQPQLPARPGAVAAAGPARSRRAGRPRRRQSAASSGASRCTCSASNLLNRVNRARTSASMTSPFFRHPTSAQAARRVELGLAVLVLTAARLSRAQLSATALIADQR